MSTSTQTTTRGTRTPEPGTWVIEPQHSSIEAVARHMMVTKVRGSFGSFSGTVEVAEDVTDSTIEVVIDAASIDTGVEDRDQHLRSEDFLHVEEHPEMTFTSTSIEPAEDGRYRVTGDLTIRGKTNPVELDVSYFGVSEDPWGNPRALFEASTTLQRSDWGMTWNQALEAGGVLVSRSVDVEISVQLVREEDAG